MWINGRMPSGTPQEIAAYWIERFRWDSLYEADRARGRTYSEWKHPFGQMEIDGTGAWVRPHYAVMVNQAGRGEADRMVRVGTVERAIPVRLDEDRVITVDQSAQTRAMLESRLRAELTVEYDSNRSAWVPLVRLRWVGERDAEGSLLFGGMVSVDFVTEGTPVDQGRKLLESRNEQTWWLVDPPQEGYRRSDLVARPERNSRFAGEVEPNWILPSVRDRSSYRLVVRITPMQSNVAPTYGGLWAERAYGGVLVLPLDGWTIEEVRRYIVNGVVPDHAMP
jgi:hypothetical protein